LTKRWHEENSLFINGTWFKRDMQQPRQQEEFGYPPLTDKAKFLATHIADTLDDVGFQYGSAVGVMTHEDGSVTVAISGSPAAMTNARNILEPRLQMLQHQGGLTGYRFGPEMPDETLTPLRPVMFPDGTDRTSPTCAEPRLGEAARAQDSPPDGMAVVWRAEATGRNNPYPDARQTSHQFMYPCNSCAINCSIILNGPSSE
jgi:hypothetical protein